MNCHGNQDDKSNQKDAHSGHGHGGHMIMMVLCCGLPIVLLASLPFLTKLSPAFAQFVGSYAFLLCPLLMIPMMFMMMKPKKPQLHHDHEEHVHSEEIAERKETLKIEAKN